MARQGSGRRPLVADRRYPGGSKARHPSRGGKGPKPPAGRSRKGRKPAPRRPRRGPIGWLLSLVTGLLLLIWRVVWGVGWRVGLVTGLLLAAAINLPLALAFAYTGELRNLSLLFVGFTVLSAWALTPPDKAALEPALNRASAS